MYFAPGMKITLLKRNFYVAMVAVDVARMSTKRNKLPHTLMLVRCVTHLLGQMSQKNLGSVTLLVPNGTSAFKMKYMVLVLSILLPTS